MWSLKNYPATLRPWDSVYSLGSMVLMFGLWIWVLFALTTEVESCGGVRAVSRASRPARRQSRAGPTSPRSRCKMPVGQ